ncbi:MAG: hypothetical protein O7G85_10485 [Planctomycetota bacterium]|nr:hypothetical protein [Planctomycetota bacterium]
MNEPRLAMLLLGIPPLLVWSMARSRFHRHPLGLAFAMIVIALPCLAPLLVRELTSPMRVWVLAILALFLTLRSWEVLRLPAGRLGGWWRTTLFIYLWPALCYDGFLRPVGEDRWRRVAVKTLSASLRIPIGLGLFALGAWLGCPEKYWALDHLLKLLEIYIFMGGMHDLIVASFALLGLHLDDVFRWPVFSKSVLDFWQRYSRHVNAWLRANVFLASGGRRHPVPSILLVFIFSSVIHEYVFLVALGIEDNLGWQTAFFMLHGLVAITGLWAGRRLIALGIHIPRVFKIALTFTFIYFSSLLFMHCMDAMMTFHEGGIGTRLLNWAMGR